MMSNGKISDRELLFERVFDAPAHLVFDAWTKSEHLVNWWGPNGFTLTNKEMNAVPGGVWRFIMHGPDGRDYVNRVVFIEVNKPSKLVYKHDNDGGTEPINFHVTIDFKEVDGKTNLTMRSVFATAEELEKVESEYGAIEGARQHLARLENYLKEMPAHRRQGEISK